MRHRGGHPRRYWMNPSHGFLSASRSLSNARTWFNPQALGGNVTEGRALLERELSRLGIALPKGTLDRLAPRFNMRTGDDLLAALGAGDLALARITHALSGEQSAA